MTASFLDEWLDSWDCFQDPGQRPARFKRDLEAERRKLSQPLYAVVYRPARSGEVDKGLLYLARNVAALAANRLRIPAPRVNAMVEGQTGDWYHDFGFDSPNYGWCLLGDDEIYISFSQCKTQRRVAKAAAHETYHVATDYSHKGESIDLCDLFAEGIAQGLGLL